MKLNKLSLMQQVTYEIRVPGELDSSWLDWCDEMRYDLVHEDDVTTITVITSVFDQAGLHGLLRRLYTFGLPLISVIWVDEG